MFLWLFIFGAAIGSFLNVVSLRYEPENFLFSPKILSGRSHCPECGKTLRWFELIPIASFILQRGRCNDCGKRISFQYPLVEILSGLIFILVPLRLHQLFFYLPPTTYYLLSISWIIVFLFLLLMSAIDMRLSLIPDEINILLAFLAVFIIPLLPRGLGVGNGSLLKSYELLAYTGGSVWLNHVIAALVALVFFGLIIFITRGRGMGLGDLKLAVPLGFVFGFPDIVLVAALSFIIGSIYGVYAIARGEKKFKSSIPFGPFLALAAAATFFGGYEIVSFYFSLFRL